VPDVICLQPITNSSLLPNQAAGPTFVVTPLAGPTRGVITEAVPTLNRAVATFNHKLKAFTLRDRAGCGFCLFLRAV